MSRQIVFVYSLIVFFSVSTSACAQDPEFEWFNNWGSISSDTMSVVEDPDGNIVTAGYFYWSDDLDPGPGTSTFSGEGMEAYVSKVDSNGNLLWAHSWGDPNTNYGTDFAVSVATDSVGNVIVFGQYQGTVDFDPGVGVQNRTYTVDGATFVVKLDPTGSFVWLVTLNDDLPPDWNVPRCLGVDSDDNVYAVWSSATKISPGGTVVWSRSLTGSYSFTCVNFDSAGHVYLGGEFTGMIDSDPGASTATLVSAGNKDIVLLELNSDGDYLWSARLGGTGEDSILALAFDADDAMYSTGYFSSTVDFDPGAPVVPLVGVTGTNIFVLKLNANHNYLWSNGFGDPNTVGLAHTCRGSDIAIDEDGTVYVTGSFVGSTTFGLQPSPLSLSGNPYENVFLLKLFPWGARMWVGGAYGGRGNGLCLGADRAVTLAIHHPGVPVDYDFGPGSQVFPALSVPSAGTLKMSQAPRSVPLTPCSWMLTVALVAALPIAYKWNRGNLEFPREKE